MLRRSPSRFRDGIDRWIRRDVPAWWMPAVILVAGSLVGFSLLTLAGPPVTDLDQYLYDLRLVPKSSSAHHLLTVWVMLGQRAPVMVIAGLYALHRSRRLRSGQPLVLYATASLLFMTSVGFLKYFTGRVGPRYTDQAHTVWDGGNIYPSGHVAGAVALYGVIALLAPVAHRRMVAWAVATLVLSIGASTVALNTHWCSDVVGAMLVGALVLLISWAAAPALHRYCSALIARGRFHHERLRARTDGVVGTGPKAVEIPSVRIAGRRGGW